MTGRRELQVEISDYTGNKVISTGISNGNTISIPTSDFIPGSYFVKVSNRPEFGEDYKSTVKALMIER